MADTNLDKVPPQNLEAEMAVLGSMLLDEEAIATGVEILDRNFFYKDTHQKIFQAISDLYAANKAVDLITLTDALKREGSLDSIGGVSYLTALANSVPTSAINGRAASLPLSAIMSMSLPEPRYWVRSLLATIVS